MPGQQAGGRIAAAVDGPELALRRRLRVDPIRCDGHGLCAELFPERVRRDDWGYPIIERAAIDESMLDLAKRAVDACPVLALRLERIKEG